MGHIPKREPLDGLGNHIYLEKQDRLREIGVDIPTSQIVVVGSQSSGKSSLLENLTGFAFPRGQGLCTRYATQITLRRSLVESIVISIIPWRDSNVKKKGRLREFRHELEDFEGENLAGIIEKRPHLTVIDVPGLFQVTDEGVTTELDKAKVENMVRRYMENKRTIVLAVMSALSDLATEGVLQFAKTADPEGVRTVGVLTKADLVTEQAVVQSILQLVKGNTLKLGYFLVCNRGADADALSIAECQMQEKAKFSEPQWIELAKYGRTGVEHLRAELQRLEVMGPSRETAASQRECLIRLTSKFEQIIRDALDGRYEGLSIFKDKAGLKLATEIIDLNEGFSDLMWRKGHAWKFEAELDEGTVGSLPYEERIAAIQASVPSIPELHQIVHDRADCPLPEEPIRGHIEKYYRESRGPELGTFGGSLLAMTFRDQASKWRSIVMAHIETVIVVVHRFIKTLLDEIFVDPLMRQQLWNSALLEKLQIAYERAKEQANFLLDIEIDGRPSTYNHYFNDSLQKIRADRLTEAFVATKQSNAEQVKVDIHDILKSYYKVSRKRFVDVICRQAIEHFLLDRSGSPLKVLTPGFIGKMSDAQLDMIAGEDGATKRERERLESEIKGLEAATKLLRV
ncbi:hypothetical protein N0V88_005104 [Collariella sp. IMI 366227]|nr:hypothetical protein N0V88_005104 [Collariella sp. IMI 366227]